MSKSRGNAVEPWEVLDDLRRGRASAGTSSPPSSRGTATASRPRRSARACACSSSSCGPPTTSTPSTRTPRRASWQRGRAPASERPRARTSTAGRSRATAGTAELVAERLEAYDATAAGRAIAALVDDLSNWYVRRSRRRFWDGEPAAFATLRTCLLTVAKLLAPLCPFIADEIYDNLDGDARERPPVRLPAARGDRGARRGARAGDGARARDGPPRPRRARQGQDQGPPAARRGRRRRRRAASARRSNGSPTSSARSSTCAGVRFVAAAEELGSYEVKANYRTLGPLFGERHAAGGGGDRGARPAPRRRRAARRRRGRDLGRRARAHAHRRGPDPHDARPRGLQRRARGRPRRGARSDHRRGPAARGPRARDRPRGPERPQERRPPGRGPHRAARSTATPRCSRRRAPTATTSPARRSPSGSGSADGASLDHSEETAIEGLLLTIGLRRAPSQTA